jgi:DNA-binding transcriptional LysR family regulator
VTTPSPDLNLLRTFLAVHRAGSFTAAAPVLGLTQPSVTTQIRTLEAQIDRVLFTRLPRGVEPTPYAHELADRVRGPLDELGSLHTGECDLDGVATPVHLAGPSELLCTRVLPALAPLVAAGVQLRVGQGQTDPLLEELRDGQQDLVITTRRPRGRALESTPLSDEEYVLVADPHWASVLDGRADGVPLCHALREVPLVSFAADMPIVRRYWRAAFGKQQPPVGAALTVPNLHAVLAAVRAGAGYSVLPRSLCQESLDEGRIVRLQDQEDPPLNTLFLVQRPGAECNPAVVRVREALQEAAQGW